MSNLLEVKNVVKKYGDYVALNEVSLTDSTRKYLWTFWSKWSWKNITYPNYQSNYDA